MTSEYQRGRADALREAAALMIGHKHINCECSHCRLFSISAREIEALAAQPVPEKPKPMTCDKCLPCNGGIICSSRVRNSQPQHRIARAHMRDL